MKNIYKGIPKRDRKVCSNPKCRAEFEMGTKLKAHSCGGKIVRAN